MSWEGYTGKTVEDSLLGSPRLEEYKEKYSENYVPYKESMQAVRELQRANPEEPYTDFADDLKVSIAMELGQDDWSRVKYYTAVGTHFDYKHGVDAFFDLTDEHDRVIATVTVDLTTNQQKEAYKADVIIQVPSGGVDRRDPDGPSEYMEVVKEAAQVVSEKFKQLTYKN